MAEGLGGGERYSARYETRDPDVELMDIVKKLDYLMSKLVESGPNLTAQMKAHLRQQIENLLAQLGISDLSQLSDVKAYLYNKVATVPHPHGYPSEDEFAFNLQKVIESPPQKHLPKVWSSPQASEVAEFGQANWKKVKGRGMNTVDYEYRLGAVMSSELHYKHNIDVGDEIAVLPDWQLDNGLHRGLALRALGQIYVVQSGMDRWVNVQVVK